MSRDPFEDGIGIGMSIFTDLIKFFFMLLTFLIQVILPLVISIIPYLCLFCFFAFSIQASFTLAPLIGLCFGIFQSIPSFAHIDTIRARLSRDGSRSSRSISGSFSTIFTIATYCFQREYEWLRISTIETNVAPGDDTRPRLEGGFVRFLPGPYWIRTLYRMCLHIILFVSVPGIWLGVLLVSLFYMIFSFPGSLAHGIAGIFRTRQPGER